MLSTWAALPSANIDSTAHERALAAVLPAQFNRAKDEVMRVVPKGAPSTYADDGERISKVAMATWVRESPILLCALHGGSVVLCNVVSGSKATLFQAPKADDDPFVDDGNFIAAACVDALRPQVLLVSIVQRKVCAYVIDPLRSSTYEQLLERTPTFAGMTVVSDLGAMTHIGECTARFSSTLQFLLIHVHSRDGARWGVVQRRGASSLSLLHSWQTDGSKRITDACWARNGIAAFSTDRGEVLLVDVVTMSQLVRISVAILPISRLVAFALTSAEVLIVAAAENLLQSVVVDIQGAKRSRSGAPKAPGATAEGSGAPAQSALPLASWSAAEFMIQDLALVVCGGKEGGSHVVYALLENGVLVVLHGASLRRVHGEEIRVVDRRPQLAVREGISNAVAIVDNAHVVIVGR